MDLIPTSCKSTELRLQDADSGASLRGHARLQAALRARTSYIRSRFDMLFYHPLTDKDWSNS